MLFLSADWLDALEGALLRPSYTVRTSTFTTPPINVLVGFGADLPSLDVFDED